MTPTVTLETAITEEAGVLAELSRRAFDSDLDIGAPEPGGPPGYDDTDWQLRMMRAGDYYSLIVDEVLAGGAIVLEAAPGECELARIFLCPVWHRQGVGLAAMALVMEQYPQAKRWILDTPAWNPRTRAFYERLGFVEYGTLTLQNGFELVLFEKHLDSLF